MCKQCGQNPVSMMSPGMQWCIDCMARAMMTKPPVELVGAQQKPTETARDIIARYHEAQVRDDPRVVFEGPCQSVAPWEDDRGHKIKRSLGSGTETDMLLLVEICERCGVYFTIGEMSPKEWLALEAEACASLTDTELADWVPWEETT